MARFRHRRPHPKPRRDHAPDPPELLAIADPGYTGSEASFMKSLVESREIVTIVLKDGEILRGRIRYYDRDCFSVGQAGGSRRFFLRKNDVSSILLEKQEKAESRRGAMEQPPALGAD